MDDERSEQQTHTNGRSLVERAFDVALKLERSGRRGCSGRAMTRVEPAPFQYAGRKIAAILRRTRLRITAFPTGFLTVIPTIERGSPG